MSRRRRRGLDDGGWIGEIEWPRPWSAQLGRVHDLPDWIGALSVRPQKLRATDDQVEPSEDRRVVV